VTRRTVAVRTSDGRTVAERCELADSFVARGIGLLGRKSLEPGGGMLIGHTGSVHMFFMRFAIDAVFLDRSQTVVKVAANLRPWRIAMARRAKSVLELPAGTVDSIGLKPGDRLLVGD
jgi:uncharacterized membrane protein (UPF0127 family)